MYDGTDNGSCQFHCTAPAALCGAGVCLRLFLLLNIVYLLIFAKLWLVVGITKQMSKPSKIMLTSFRSVDMIFLGLTIHYVHLLKVWHLYSVTYSWSNYVTTMVNWETIPPQNAMSLLRQMCFCCTHSLLTAFSPLRLLYSNTAKISHKKIM